MLEWSPMKASHLRALAVLFVLAGAYLLGTGMRKHITLIVDSDPRQINTFAFTTGQLLREQGFRWGPQDELEPPADHWLRDHDTVRLDKAARVLLQVDGEQRTMTSTMRLPANLISGFGAKLYPGDEILLDGQPLDPDKALPQAKSYSLELHRAIQVNLETEEGDRTFSTTASTLEQALQQEGITLQPADRLDPPPGTPLTANGPGVTLQARLRRAQPVTFQVDGERISFRTTANTVGESLAEAGLALQGLDYSQPSADAPLPKDGQIRVVRVGETVDVEQEPLPFETELVRAPEVELDTRKVLQPGVPGLLARRFRTRYEDGVEVSRQSDGEWVARQPQKQVTGYGAKIVIRTLQTPSGPIEYWRAVSMYATSYSPCRIYKDHCDSYTALGYELKRGVVAMTNYWCRTTCGDQVYVPGYGTGVVADTGGGIPGRYWIDLGYSESDYVSWHQWVTVYFLTPVPSNYMEVLP